MKRIGIAAVVFVFASAANAQSVSGRVTGAVGEVGSVVGQTGVGPALSGPQAPGSSNLPNSSFLGGELPGGIKMKLGDKVIDLRGNVGVGDNAAISKPALACRSKSGSFPRAAAQGLRSRQNRRQSERDRAI